MKKTTDVLFFRGLIDLKVLVADLLFNVIFKVPAESFQLKRSEKKPHTHFGPLRTAHIQVTNTVLFMSNFAQKQEGIFSERSRGFWNLRILENSAGLVVELMI